MPRRKPLPGLARLILVALTLPAAAIAQEASKSDLVSALREGGHVVYIRHAQTESDYADQIDADPAGLRHAACAQPDRLAAGPHNRREFRVVSRRWWKFGSGVISG